MPMGPIRCLAVMPPWSLFSAATLCAAGALLTATGTATPIVDLGYTLQQATLGHTNNGVPYYNFSNIRYAAPPTGELRFAAPTQPEKSSTVQNGQIEYICPQAIPGWLTTASEFVNGKPLTDYRNYTKKDIPPVDPRTSEDCLFLDVLASRSVFDKKDAYDRGAAVLVWIHGGGYTAGYKDADGDGQNFIRLSSENKDGGIVYVAINYRLGLFGWLGAVAGKQGAVANAGLLDQRFALEWVQKYIHLFGGDPRRVTIIGESAGGGSLVHQITAYGGALGAVPFSRAILQSPFLQPIPPSNQDRAFQQVLKKAHVSNYNELRSVSSQRLQTVNSLVVGNSEPYGTFVFGPVIDGSFVPDLPGPLLANGRFDQSINVMTGHNADEGLTFTSPFVKTDSAYRRLLRHELPGISAAALNHITKVLYPPNFDGSFGYTDQIGRTDLTMGDFSVDCNTYFLNSALSTESYAYQFSVPPPLHGFDLAYTFYKGGPAKGVNTTLAVLMQRYFLNFAVIGSPNAKDLPVFPRYHGQKEMNFNNSRLKPIPDETASRRCRWWQKGLYA